jgi:hypothetical protein
LNITFYNFYLSNPSFSNLVLSLFVSTTIRDILSGLADLRATLGTPPASDGVPPEAAILGFHRASVATGQTGAPDRSDRSGQELGEFSVSTFRSI